MTDIFSLVLVSHQPMGLWTMLTFCQDAGSSTPLIPSYLCFINGNTLSNDWFSSCRVQGDVKGKYLIKSFLSVSNIWFPHSLTYLPSHWFLKARRPLQLTLFIHFHLHIYWNQIWNKINVQPKKNKRKQACWPEVATLLLLYCCMQVVEKREQIKSSIPTYTPRSEREGKRGEMLSQTHRNE